MCRLPWASRRGWPALLLPHLPFTSTVATPTPHVTLQARFPLLFSCLPSSPFPVDSQSSSTTTPSFCYYFQLLCPIILSQHSPGKTRSSSNRKAVSLLVSLELRVFPKHEPVSAELGKRQAMWILGHPEGNCPLLPFSASHTFSSVAQLPPGNSCCSSFSRANLVGAGMMSFLGCQSSQAFS